MTDLPVPVPSVPSWRLRAARPSDLPALLGVDPVAAGDSVRITHLQRWLAAQDGPAGPERPVVLVVAPAGPGGATGPGGRGDRTGPDGPGRARPAGHRPQDLAGYVVLRPGHFFGRDLVEQLAVHPSRQRRGIGRALLRAALAAADTSRVFTSTNAANVAMRGLLSGDGWTSGGALDGLNPDLAPGRADLELVWFRDTPHPTGPDARLLHHLALARDWEAARSDGWYRTSTLGSTVDQTGFVHASFPAQLCGVAERFYAGVAVPLVLLTIDRERLVPPVLVEPAAHLPPDPEACPGTAHVPGPVRPGVAAGGTVAGPWAMFPHVYGPVNVDAVVAVHPLSRDATGRWNLP